MNYFSLCCIMHNKIKYNYITVHTSLYSSYPDSCHIEVKLYLHKHWQSVQHSHYISIFQLNFSFYHNNGDTWIVCVDVHNFFKLNPQHVIWKEIYNYRSSASLVCHFVVFFVYRSVHITIQVYSIAYFSVVCSQRYRHGVKTFILTFKFPIASKGCNITYSYSGSST